MYRFETIIKLYHTDAAGLLFFGQQFFLAHDAYQSFIESCGYSFADVIREGKHLLPIVHAEADFLLPVMVGDRICIELVCSRIGTTSFTLDYGLMRGTARVGSARTVHVWIDRRTGQKQPLPELLRQALAGIS